LHKLALPLQKSGYGNYLMSILNEVPPAPRAAEPATLQDLALGALRRQAHAMTP
jgi:hypothetical protein